MDEGCHIRLALWELFNTKQFDQRRRLLEYASSLLTYTQVTGGYCSQVSLYHEYGLKFLFIWLEEDPEAADVVTEALTELTGRFGVVPILSLVTKCLVELRH